MNHDKLGDAELPVLEPKNLRAADSGGVQLQHQAAEDVGLSQPARHTEQFRLGAGTD